MRWGSTGNGSFAVGASAYAFASRDENASYYYYQEPSEPLTAATGVPQNQGHSRRAVQARKPPDKQRLTRRNVGNNTRPSSSSAGSPFSEREAVDRPEGIADEPEPIKPPIIMCAGKSLYGSTSDTRVDESRSNNDNQHLGPDNNNADTGHNNQTTPFRSTTATKSNKLSEPYSPPRHRTDEELEQIIRDLRQQVFQQQQHQNHGQQMKLATETDNTQKHHRKHLKNPIEKMERVAPTVPVAASIGVSSMTNGGVLLQRPLSSCYLNRLVAENTIQMVVPAIIYEAPAVTARGGCRSSGSSNADDQASSLQKSRPKSSSGCHPSVKPPSRQLRSKQTSGSMRIHREQVRRQNGDEYSSDYDDSFLYLVDAEDDDEWPESVSLSPVGPWVVDEFVATGTATETPCSPSVSTCHSVSSLGSDDLECDDGNAVWSNSELAAMSPRSRLLYFSACVDDVETSRSTISHLPHQQTLRRSVTCGSGLLGNTKFSAGRPKRCSSAKTARHKHRISSVPASKVSKQKSSCQVRKRPHGGGIVSTRSDGSTSTS
ncbi:hypothetical protein ON010_g5765 [Phytophthora cinnamomi]|nr:hypothetical protein ON010_g5765 [Phytophthora cinnamomi]